MENKKKNQSVNRAAYITILTILAVMAVLVAATSSANRARRGKDDTSLPIDTTVPAPVTTAAPATTRPPMIEKPDGETTAALPGIKPITTAPVTTAAPATEPSAPTASTLPKLTLPVSGNLIKAHDLDVPVFSTTMNDYRTHCGIDIAAQPGASVCAAADGVIAQIWEDPMMGQCISVKHAGDGLTIYRNLSPILPVGISEGVSVRAGQLIANIGESAMIEIAEEPHLHFEMMVGDEYVNPLDYLLSDVKTSLSLDEYYEG